MSFFQLRSSRKGNPLGNAPVISMVSPTPSHTTSAYLWKLRKTIHVGSYSQDSTSLIQTDTDAMVTAIVSAIPNVTHIAIGTFLDFDSTSVNDQFAKWASSVHAAGKSLYIRSAGFNDWQGSWGATQYTSADFADHHRTKMVTWLGNNAASLQAGDVFEPVPDEPENNTMWNTTYGTIGSGTGKTAFNTFVAGAISDAKAKLVLLGKSGIEVGVVHTNPSAAKDVIDDTTALSITTLGTDTYPDNGAADLPAYGTAMASELATWATPNKPTVKKDITFGPSIYTQLTQQDQADATGYELAAIQNALGRQLGGITIWQGGNQANDPYARIFDWSGSAWVPRTSTKIINSLFSTQVVTGAGFTRSHVTDTLRHTTPTKFHTTDALRRAATLKTHTTDANKKKAGVIKIHTTDAFRRIQVAKVHTTDALKRKATTKIHTADANKRVAGLTKSQTTDTLKRAQTIHTHTTDTLKRKQSTNVHTADALKRKVVALTHTTDAAILRAKRLNLVPNPSFEVNLTGWTPYGAATLTRDTTQFYTGTASMRIDTDGSGTGGFGWMQGGNYTASGLTVGKTYTVSFWLKGPIGQRTYVYLGSKQGGGDGGSSFTIATSGWARYSATFIAGASTSNSIVGVEDVSGSPQTYYVDSVLFEPTPSSALTFTGGNNGYVAAPYSFPTDAYTVLFWYKSSAIFGSAQGWFGQAGSLSIGRQGLNSVEVYAYLNASADFAGPRRLRIHQSAQEPATDGLWHSRAYVIYVNSSNHGAVDSYEDGSFLSTTTTNYTGDTTSPSGNLGIGSQSITSGATFDGSMDRVVIVNRKLSASEVTAFHGGVIPANPGALWSMDEGSGTTVADSTPNANNGAFAGPGTAPVWLGSGVTELPSSYFDGAQTGAGWRGTANNSVSYTDVYQLTRVHSTDANRRAVSVKTHTTGAYLRLIASFTRTHTTDALKRAVGIRTHTTSANLKKAGLVKIHSTDANKKLAGITKLHTTDALKRAVYTRVHTTDANKRKNIASTHTTDSLKRSQRTNVHTTDTLKRIIGTRSFSTDAFKRISALKTHTTDALRRKTVTKLHTTDALKRSILTKTQTTDALKRKINVKVHTTDALKRKVATRSHTTDALKRAAIVRSHSTDAAVLFARRLNFITNPQFDNSLQDWSAGGTVDTTYGTVINPNSFKFTTIGNWDEFHMNTVIPVKAGDILTASVYVTSLSPHTSGASGNTNAIIYCYWQGAGGEITWTGATVDLATVRTGYRLTGTLTAPTGAVAATFYVYQYGVGTAYYNAPMVERNATVTPYFDGDSINAGWRGTVDYSTSYSLSDVYPLTHTTDSYIRSGATLTHTTDALKKKAGVTRTHTTDALKRAIVTRLHSTDANKRKAGLVRTHTTDSLKRVSSLKTHTTDALKRKTVLKQHTTDANKRVSVLRSHTTDANRRKVTLKIHSTDANKRVAALVRSHTTDANKRIAGILRTHTTDTLKRVSLVTLHTTDAATHRQFVPTHTTDTIKRTINTKAHSTDANKRKLTSRIHTTDTLKRAITVRTHTTDANKRKAGVTRIHATDTLLRKLVARTHTTDANRRKITLSTHSTDVLKRKATIVSHSTDANKRKTAIVRSHSTDANKRRAGLTLSHTTDAFLRISRSIAHSTDAFLYAVISLVHSADGFKRLNDGKFHVTDALKRAVDTIFHTTSANKRAAGLLLVHSTDALKRTLNIKTHATDANKRKTSNVTHTTSANKRKLTTKIHTTSANKRKALSVSHTTSALLRKANTVSHTTSANKLKANVVQHAADALKRKLFTQTHTTDANKRKPLSAIHSTDANKRKLSTVIHAADTNLRKTTVTLHTTDALKFKRLVRTHTTDSFLRRRLSIVHTTDANKRKATLVSHTTDVFIRTGNQRLHSTDTNKRRALTAFHTTSTNKRTVGLTLSHLTDTFKRVARNISHTTDTLLRRRFVVGGYHLHFDGINNEVAWTNVNPPLPSAQSSVTIAGKFRLGADGINTADSQVVVAYRYWYLHIRNTTNAVNWRYDNAAARVTSGANLGLGNRTWHTFVAVYEYISDTNINMTLYLDGVKTTSNQTTLPTTNVGNGKLGRRGAGATYYSGDIKDIRVYHSAANDSQAASIAAGINAVTPVVDFRFYEGTGSTLYDLSGNNNHGTITGATWVSQTHTTDANKRKATTVSHSTDTLRRAAFTKVHSTDVLKRKPSTKSHSTDANKRQTRAIAHITDTFKRKATVVSHLTDTVKRKTNIFTHTASANKRRALLVVQSTDTSKRRGGTSVHTADALKRKVSVVNHSTSAWLHRSYVIGHLTDTNRRKFYVVRHSTDLYVSLSRTVSHSTNAVLHGHYGVKKVLINGTWHYGVVNVLVGGEWTIATVRYLGADNFWHESRL